MRRIIPILLATLVAIHHSLSCGISWGPPTSHFNGVDSQGNVWLVEKLATLEVAPDFKIPIYATFDSSRGGASPMAGAGWSVPLFETRMVQVSENVFKMHEPSGRYRIYVRDKKNSNILNGQAGWKAEINGDTIVAAADCGDKITLQSGRMVTFESQGHELDFLHHGAHFNEIRLGSTRLLKVDRIPGQKEIVGFTLKEGGQARFEFGNRPQIQSIGGNNLVSGYSRALTRVMGPGALIREYAYGVDNANQPNIIVDSNRILTWNPVTSLAISDGAWNYNIKARTRQFGNAEILRTDKNSKTEYWHRDNKVGKELFVDSEGLTIAKTWFTSGKLNGLVRSEVTTKNSKTIKRVNYSYDENRDLIRTVTTTPDQSTVETFKNGLMVERTSHDSKGVAQSRDTYDSEGYLQSRTRLDGSYLTSEIVDGKRVLRDFRSDGTLRSEREYSGARILRAMIVGEGETKFEYTDKGQVKSIVSSLGDTTETMFDPLGGTVGQVKNGAVIAWRVPYPGTEDILQIEYATGGHAVYAKWIGKRGTVDIADLQMKFPQMREFFRRPKLK